MLAVDVCKVQHCVRLWTLNYFLLIVCWEQAVLFISVTWSHCAAGWRVGSADSAHNGTQYTQQTLLQPSLCSHLPRLWKSPVLQAF